MALTTTSNSTHSSAVPYSSTQWVLIYRLGSLGDMLVALPALHLVARAFRMQSGGCCAVISWFE
jgi:heptosyltransferase-3